MTMSLVVDANGVPEVQDGKPVIQYDDGRKAPLDFVHLISQVKKVSDERDTFKNQYETAANAARAFEGVTPELLTAAKNLNGQKLVEAGKVDELIATRTAEAKAAWDKREQELANKVKESEGRIFNLLVSQRFATSKALEDTFLTPDIAEAYWGKNFKVDGDRVIGHYPNGQPIYSAAKPGEPADFDEALAILKASHPNKDKWTKGSNATGSGAPGSNGNGNGAKSMPRVQFQALSPGEQMNRMREGYHLTD